MSPHVTDRATRDACADLLGLRRGEVSRDLAGRPRIDQVADAQLIFRAQLAAAVMRSTLGDLPLQAVRAAATLRSVAHYVTAIIDGGDRLVMRTRAPGRVAARLLPALYPGNVVAGMPGLRIGEITPRTIQLIHLPTGGRLDLTGSLAPSPTTVLQCEDLTDELQLALHKGDVGLSGNAHVHPEEARHLYLTPAPSCPRLLSAVLNRAVALWWHYGIEPAYCPTGHLTWRPGPCGRGTVSEIGQLLTQPPLTIPQATYTATGAACGILTLAAERLSLHTTEGPV